MILCEKSTKKTTGSITFADCMPSSDRHIIWPYAVLMQFKYYMVERTVRESNEFVLQRCKHVNRYDRTVYRNFRSKNFYAVSNLCMAVDYLTVFM